MQGKCVRKCVFIYANTRVCLYIYIYTQNYVYTSVGSRVWAHRVFKCTQNYDEAARENIAVERHAAAYLREQQAACELS